MSATHPVLFIFIGITVILAAGCTQQSLISIRKYR